MSILPGKGAYKVRSMEGHRDGPNITNYLSEVRVEVAEIIEAAPYHTCGACGMVFYTLGALQLHEKYIHMHARCLEDD